MSGPALVKSSLPILNAPTAWIYDINNMTLQLGLTTFQGAHKTYTNLLMAANAGVASLAVSYGAHEPDVLASHSPLATFSRVDDLSAWLKSNA